MGKAMRWLKGLFGMSKLKELNSNSSSGDGKSKKSSSVGRSGRERGTGAFCHNPETIPPNLSPAEATWLSSYYTETENDQSKHAIAVAAATAAAADAAVAAAQAAAAVVRLTSQGRGTMFCDGAAMKIQTVFRGFLARKALRALKGLVKIQALVRGFLVRKQATATLHGMQALIRAQATVRAQKFNRAQIGARKPQERFDGELLGSVHSRRLSASLDVDETPKIVEVDTGRPKSRSRRTNTSISDFGDDPFFQTLSSPNPSCRLSIPEIESLAGDECRFSTAQSTPRFTNSGGDNLFRQYPSYMASTQSFKAKLRSYSAPKQRPEPKKRLSLNEVMESRSSLSGVRMQRSCSQVQEAISFKNAVMGKLDRSLDFTRRYSVSGNVRN